MEKVFEIYIKTTPERLWQAITDKDLRRKYNFGVGVDSPTGHPARTTGASTPRRPARCSRARTWRSIRPAGSSRASPPCGART